MSSFRPCLTVTWSSTRRIRSRFPRSAMGRNPGRRRVRHANEDGRPLPGGGFDRETCAAERGALLHAEQAETLCAACRIEAGAVVFDDEQNLIGAALENDLDTGRA